MVLKVRRVISATGQDLEVKSLSVLPETMGVSEMVPLIHNVRRERAWGRTIQTPALGDGKIQLKWEQKEWPES